MNATLKCNYELIKIVKEICLKKGIKIQYFTEEALKEKIERMQK